MFYSPSNPSDKKLHKRFHEAHTKGPFFRIGRKSIEIGENLTGNDKSCGKIVKRCDLSIKNTKIVIFDGSGPYPKSVKKVLSIMDNALNCGETKTTTESEKTFTKVENYL